MVRPSYPSLNARNVVLMDSVLRPNNRMIAGVLTDHLGLRIRNLGSAVAFPATSRPVGHHVPKVTLSGILSKVVGGIVRPHPIPMAHIHGMVSGAVERLKYHVMDQRHGFLTFTTKVYLHVAVLTGTLRFQLTSDKIDPAVDVVTVPIQRSHPTQGRYLIVPFVSNYRTPFFGHPNLLFDGVDVSRVLAHVNL